MTRILVTGSRVWPDRQAVWEALNQHAQGPTTVVHGRCPSGADYWASLWVATMRTLRTGHREDPHPADWQRYGTAAGMIRNQQMVNLGAAVCLAFPYGKSPGTRDCMHRAKLSGIQVINLGDDHPTVEREETEGLW